MTSPPFTPKFRPPRDLARAVARGFRGRCPRCGQGRLLAGYISPVSECAICGEHLQPCQTADFAPYLVVFAIALTLPPRAKGAAIALLWTLDIRAYQ